MKQKKFKKLRLNKQTIGNLSNTNMQGVFGGLTTDVPTQNLTCVYTECANCSGVSCDTWDTDGVEIRCGVGGTCSCEYEACN